VVSVAWHGNTYEALQHLETLEMDLDAATDEENKDTTTRKLLRAVEEFHTYIANNQAFIPNYGERYRQGDRISTGFVESAVNYVVAKRFTKRQQMQWSPKGAHLLIVFLASDSKPAENQYGQSPKVP
jgi:hypothetical protein